MLFGNQFSRISLGSSDAGTSHYTTFSADRHSGARYQPAQPDDSLRTEEWIRRLQDAARRVREDYTQDLAARAEHQRHLQVSHPSFEQELPFKNSADEDTDLRSSEQSADEVESA